MIFKIYIFVHKFKYKSMTKFSQQHLVFIALVAMIIGLAFSGSHPVTGTSGYTGAPGDSFCSSCHSGSNPNFNGNVEISGLPGTIQTNTTYTITVSLTNPNGNAIKGGFQLLALNGTNQNAGTFSGNASFTSLKTVSGGKTYFGHEPAQNFSGSNPLTFTVDWTSPPTAATGQVKFYASGILANNNGGNSGDRPVGTNLILPLQGSSTPISLSLSNIMNPECNGTNTGRATVNIMGGTPPYNILWSNGETSANAFFLPAGNVSVTVTDAPGMSSNVSTTLVNPPSVTVNTNATDASCFGVADGSATAFGSGGTGGLIYFWSNGGTTSIQNSLSAGTYTVTVYDQFECSATSTVFIEQPPAINIITVVNLPPSCNGGNDGELEVSANGGSGGFSYLWSNGAIGNLIEGLTAGSYTVTVNDSQGCEQTRTLIVTQPNPIVVTFTNQQNVSCFGGQNGQVQSNVTGGNGSNTYVWSDGSTDNIRTDLPAGQLTVTVTDGLGCTSSSSVSITQPSSISTNLIQSIPASCSGASDGGLIVEATGGTGDKNYMWSNGVNGSSNLNISSGEYRVTVTDANSCTATAIFSVATNAPFSIVNTIDNVSCFGLNDGSINIEVIPEGDYMYIWNNGDTTNLITSLIAGAYTVTIADVTGCFSVSTISVSQPNAISEPIVEDQNILCFGENNAVLSINPQSNNVDILWSTSENTSIIGNLSAGVYSVTLTDSTNCLFIDSITVVEPDQLALDSFNVQNIDCFGFNSGSISTFGVGGTGELSFIWSNGENTSSLDDLSAGLYSLTITDGNECRLVEDFVVENAEQIVITANIINATDVDASDGSIDIQISGGNAPYTIMWSNGADTTFIDSLAIGEYQLMVLDANNCSVNQVFSISSVACTISATYTAEGARCFNDENGIINLEVTDNIGPFSFVLYKDEQVVNKELDKLNAGTYSLLIRDSVNCTFLLENIVITDGLEIFSDAAITNATQGNANGAITITPSGGVGNYRYEWYNNFGALFAITKDVSNLAAGEYSMRIIDELGCFKYFNYVVEEISSSKDINERVILNIFPNPTNGVLNISNPNAVLIEKIIISDQLGRQISTKIIQSNQILIPLDIDEILYDGIYFIKLENSNFNTIMKVIIRN